MLKLVDVAYGGENGFNQAIELAAEVLQNVKFIQEKKLIGECDTDDNGDVIYRTGLLMIFLPLCSFCREILR